MAAVELDFCPRLARALVRALQFTGTPCLEALVALTGVSPPEIAASLLWEGLNSQGHAVPDRVTAKNGEAMLVLKERVALSSFAKAVSAARVAAAKEAAAAAAEAAKGEGADAGPNILALVVAAGYKD